MAYKVFTNGSPLPASDLNTYLMNQSVMVFANSTARSAALTAPTEGMVTYLEDTNKLEVYTGAAWVDVNDNAAAIPKSTVTTAGDLIVADGNASVTRLGIGADGSIPRVASGALGYLPVGTNGQVLTVSGGAPTWTTPAASGGMTLISTTSLAGSNDIALTSIPQTYKKLVLYIDRVRSTVNDDRMIIQAGASPSTWYDTRAWNSFFTGSLVDDWGEPDVRAISNSTTELGSVYYEINNYSATNMFKSVFCYAYTRQNDWRSSRSTGHCINTAAVSALRIRGNVNGVGATFASGTAYLYGVS